MIGLILMLNTALAAVPESTLSALDGRTVALTLSDGRETTGTIEDVSGGNVVIITADGEVLTTPAAKVASVRVVTAGAPASPSKAAPASSSKAAPASPSKAAPDGAPRDAIGLVNVPPRPPSKDCTWTRSEGRSHSRHPQSFPEALVPWDHESQKVLKSSRFYDEDGNVYRFSEAANILWASDCCPEQEEKYELYQRRAVAWSIPAVGLMLLSAPVGGLLGWPFVIPELIAASHRDQQVEDALYEYNRSGGH